MAEVLLIVIVLFGCAAISKSQSVSDAELIVRLKANQSKFAEWEHGGDLRERASRLGKDITANPVVKETSIECGNCPRPDARNHPEVRNATEKSDLVAIGHIIRNISSLTASGAFIFTDSQYVVDTIWKDSKRDSPHHAIKIGDEITITGPGGTVISDGHKITAQPTNRIPLKVNHSYLVYLKYLQDSNSYIAVGFDGFDITESPVIPLRTTLKPPAQALLNDKNSFLDAMQASTSKAAVERSK